MIEPLAASANTAQKTDTDIKLRVYASGLYSNWEGVSNVSQFVDDEGNYCFAYNTDDSVIVVKTSEGKITKKINLKKQHKQFGAVECDSDGYYYLVTGEENKKDDTSVNTVFVSKYSPAGKHIKTVGDVESGNGNSKVPFDAGNCDIAINGDYIAVNYARKMYSGHQSNTVLMLLKEDLSPADFGHSVYNSHSFGQRAVPFDTGFVFASEGDCFNRAFTLDFVFSESNSYSVPRSFDIFHFWVRKNTYNDWDMFTLNENFASLGDVCSLGGGRVSFVAASAKALNSDAASQNRQIFIQILNCNGNKYITKGKRTGLGGPNGDTKVTDNGVKWLTKYTAKSGKTVNNVQAVADDDGNTIVLFELYKKGKYQGIYYCVVNKNGKVTTKISKCIKDGRLNPCETPVWANGKVWWTANAVDGGNMFIYSLEP